MNMTRRAGLLLAGVGASLWLLFAFALLSTDPDDGANIGAGLAALCALPVSMGASLALLFSSRATRPGDGTTTGRATLRAVAVLAVLSVLCLGSFLVLDPYAESDMMRTVVLAVGIGTFLLSSAGFATAGRASDRTGGR